jgi:hypothetical protein
VRVKKKYLHPAKIISDKYLNQDHNEELDGLLVLRKEKKSEKEGAVVCCVFSRRHH